MKKYYWLPLYYSRTYFANEIKRIFNKRRIRLYKTK